MPVKKLKTQNSKLKTEIRKPKASASSTVRSAGLNVPVYSLAGTKKGTASLPKEIFGAKVNENLMAQAVRVYLANQRQGTASTKSRGEITASTRKIYKQKGTGRARHGALSAPIFVGGGAAHGPKGIVKKLKLNKKQIKKALFGALTKTYLNNNIFVLTDSILKIEPKTKKIEKLLKGLKISGKKILLVYSNQSSMNLKLASRNLKNLNMSEVKALNAYQILSNEIILITQDALLKLINHFTKNEN